MRREMADLARQLGRMEHGDMTAKGVVDRFATVSLKVVLDGESNWEYHCHVGWALFLGRLSVASLLGIINDFSVKHDNLELHHEPGWYVSKVDPLILPEPDESLTN
jgi:hypothetical protein